MFGAVGHPLKGGKYYMLAEGSTWKETKRFFGELAAALRNPYGPRPYLVMDNLQAHHSDKVAEERNRFHECFQPAYSSPFNAQETCWAMLKRVYYQRLHRRDTDVKDHAEFERMIQQLCDDVHIDTDAMLRSNRAYINRYLQLGEDQSSDSF